jgi:ankyrin repeat protein
MGCAARGRTIHKRYFRSGPSATRECKNLQRVMREVMNWHRWRGRQTQLNYYCKMGMTSSVARMLEMRSIDVEAKDVHGRTCLTNAALYGHLAICRLLLDKGAQVEVKDSTGWTPLHLAARQGHVEIVRLLCDRGADVEARSSGSGRRPLHYAAMNGHISVVKELIEERNVEINARDNEGGTALTWARHENKPDVAAYLVSHGGIV